MHDTEINKKKKIFVFVAIEWKQSEKMFNRLRDMRQKIRKEREKNKEYKVTFNMPTRYFFPLWAQKDFFPLDKTLYVTICIM